MLNQNKTGLLIFDNFQIDFNLPKWHQRIKKMDPIQMVGKGEIEDNLIQNIYSRYIYGSGSRIGLSPDTGSFLQATDGFISLASGAIEKKVSLWNRIFSRKRIKRQLATEMENAKSPNFTLQEIPEQKSQDPEISVSDFFKSIKNSAEELTVIEGRLKRYEDAVDHLKKSGQIALLDNLYMELEMHRAETQLYAASKTQVITELQVAEFASKANKKIKLDWIKNFTRLIPTTIIQEKTKLDDLHIFDNYLVMHYDPDNKGSEKTQKEKDEEKDPILFGVIAGSHKLYYVGDWVDEYCDLTFSKIIETLGPDAIKANDITANIKIHTEL